jgi:hypothetical protein
MAKATTHASALRWDDLPKDIRLMIEEMAPSHRMIVRSFKIHKQINCMSDTVSFLQHRIIGFIERILDAPEQRRVTSEEYSHRFTDVYHLALHHHKTSTDEKRNYLSEIIRCVCHEAERAKIKYSDQPEAYRLWKRFVAHVMATVDRCADHNELPESLRIASIV